MYYLKPKDLLFQKNIENLYADACNIHPIQGSLIIDLGETSWIFPHSILGIVTLARLWHRWTGYQLILSNINIRLHQYLTRMNLFSECKRYLQEEQSARGFYNRSDNSQRLLEVISLPSNEQTNIIALRFALRRAKTILTSWIDNANLVGSVLTIFSEIGQNIVHSQDQGYIVMQRYGQPSSIGTNIASEIHLAIGDIGIGIQESLLRYDLNLNNRFINGSDFIQYALLQGISGQSGSRGIGLHRVSALVSRWQGSLIIRSKSSQISISNDQITVFDNLCEIPGVQVYIKVCGTIN